MTFSILREVKRPFSKKNIVQDLVAGFRSETLPHTKQLSTQQVDDDGSVKDFDENLVGFYLLALPFASNQVLGFVSNRPHLASTRNICEKPLKYKASRSASL